MTDKKMNKMGTQPISKIMLSMGIPMIISMVLQACYNIVDSIFVAAIPDSPDMVNAGEKAVNALTLAFPIQMLIIAFGIGTGVGINALLSKTLGEGNREKVEKIAGNGITLGFIIFIVFFLFGLFGTNFYLRTQTDDSEIQSLGRSYLLICTLFSLGIILFSVFEKLLQSTGKTVYSTIAQVAGAVTNIILDPIFIFGYFGLPQMGISGAAWATVIGQFVSMIIAAVLHYTKNTEILNGIKYLKPDLKIIREIYIIGLPAIIMQALMSFMTYGLNIILGKISQSAVTAYGIFYKIQQFIFFAGFGLRDAITPIVSFNYGFGDKKRVKQGIHYGILYISIIMIIGTVLLEAFANPLISIFKLSAETEALCITATRIITAGLLIAGLNIAIQGVFQALGCGISSLILSILRLFIIVLPLALFLSLSPNAETVVWFSLPISEAVALIAALILLSRANKKIINQL